MTQLLTKIIADFSTTLTAKTAIGATSATLTSGLDQDGIQLPTATYGFTIDRNNANKEYFTATLTGANLTSIKTVTRGTGVGTSGLTRTHRKGAEVIISDWVAMKRMLDVLDGTTTLDASTPLGYDGTATISTANQLATKDYVDGVAVAGGADSSTTVKGITKMSVAPASAASPIAVGDNDGRVPTQGENDALVGNNTDIAVGSGNKMVTQTGLQHGAELYAADAGANDTYVITLSPVPTSYTTGMVVHFKANTINTGAATLNVNSLGAKTIVKGVSTTLADGDIGAGQFCTVIYDGTNFVLQSPTILQPISSETASASISGTGVSTTQNIDTAVTTTFTPKIITVKYWLKGLSGAGVPTYSIGTAIFDGTTIQSVFSELTNSTSTTISATTYSVFNTSPTAGGDASNGGWTMSIQSLSATGFTLRLTYTQGSTFNGGDYKAIVSATA
jgi:hypothetical protein